MHDNLSFVGVIMFILLSGSFPFNGAGEKIYDVISKGDYTVCHDLANFVKNID
jgi:hypothetical protein